MSSKSSKDLERERLLKRITEKRARLQKRGDINIKIPRLTLPSDYNLEDRSIFSLPPEVLKPIVASAYPKYRKGIPLQKKRDADMDSKLRYFTTMRKQREEFRKRLVDLIVGREGSDDIINPNEIPNTVERDILRYYYYVQCGVDTIHVSPLDDKVLRRVLSLVPENLAKWKTTLDECIEEMRESFMLTVKKAVVDFVLQDTALTNAQPEISPYFVELREISINWKLSYNKAKKKLESTLHVVNPCLAALTDLWFHHFRWFRLINIADLKKHNGPYDLEEFKSVTSAQITKAKKKLMTHYYGAVTDIFLQGSKKNKLPETSHTAKTNSFFNSVSTIMSYHIQICCLKSLFEFVQYITDIKYSNKGFEIHLVQQINLLAFEPSFRSFKEAIIGVLDHLVDTVLTIERLETKLYIDYQQEVTFLKPTIAEEIIWNYKIQINALMDEQRIGPELRVQDFDKYMPLINGEDKIRIEKFLASPHTLDEFLELIQHFKTIADELPIINEHVISMGMYVMNRNELIGALVQAAENFRDVLVAKCTEDYLSLCKRLVRI